MMPLKLFEWGSERLDSSVKRDEFIRYLAQVWDSRNKYIETEEVTEQDVQVENKYKQRFFTFTHGGEIVARNYVGVVQYEGVRINVYPKIFSAEENPDYKKYQLNLLYWLSYCRRINFPFLAAELSELDFDDLLELLIYIFANHTSAILNEHPFQAYQEVEEETIFMRGRLSVSDYVNRNLSTGNWQHFQCVYEPFVYDNLFNRIVKFVARKLLQVTEHPVNKDRLEEILFLLNDVSDLPCTAADCKKVKLNSLFSDLQAVLDMCSLFLSEKVMDVENDDSRNFCFLVPMEYVFEDFVFGFLETHFPLYQFICQSIDSLAQVKGRNIFQIRNDIYLKDRLIIDTKYKIRSSTNDGKAGVSQSDMYQMTSYAVKRNCKKVILLYPKTEQQNESPEFVIDSKRLNEAITIQPIDINIQISSINIGVEKLKAEFKALLDNQL